MATTTIVTTGAQDVRLVKAFGAELGLGRNATAAEIRQATIDFWKGVVKRQEIIAATAAANAALESVTPIDVA